MKKAIRAKADGPKPYASRWSQTVRKSMVPDCAPAAVSGYPQAKRSGGDGAERKVRRTILLAVPPVEHTTQWGRCSKKWEGVDMQGRKRCCPEDPGHPRPQAGTRKRSAAGGMERSGRSEGQYRFRQPINPQTDYPQPTTINQQPTTTNQLPQTNHHINRQPPSTNHLQATMKKRMTYKSTGLSAGLRHDSCN